MRLVDELQLRAVDALCRRLAPAAAVRARIEAARRAVPSGLSDALALGALRHALDDELDESVESAGLLGDLATSLSWTSEPAAMHDAITSTLRDALLAIARRPSSERRRAARRAHLVLTSLVAAEALPLAASASLEALALELADEPLRARALYERLVDQAAHASPARAPSRSVLAGRLRTAARIGEPPTEALGALALALTTTPRTSTDALDVLDPALHAWSQLGAKGRYARVAALEALTAALREAPAARQRVFVRRALAHADRLGTSLTAVEIDRLRELARAMTPRGLSAAEHAALDARLARRMSTPDALEAALQDEADVFRALVAEPDGTSLVARVRSVLRGGEPGPALAPADAPEARTLRTAWLALAIVAHVRTLEGPIDTASVDTARLEEACRAWRELALLLPRGPAATDTTATDTTATDTTAIDAAIDVPFGVPIDEGRSLTAAVATRAAWTALARSLEALRPQPTAKPHVRRALARLQGTLAPITAAWLERPTTPPPRGFLALASALERASREHAGLAPLVVDALDRACESHEPDAVRRRSEHAAQRAVALVHAAAALPSLDDTLAGVGSLAARRALRREALALLARAASPPLAAPPSLPTTPP